MQQVMMLLLAAERKAILAAMELRMERQLMLLARPLAQAMTRQDELLVTMERRTHQLLAQSRVEQTDLLTAVLETLQPTAEAQLLPELAPLMSAPSRPNWTS